MIWKDARVEVINAFQWAKANVELRSPTAAIEIHRWEAESKFFRSLMVVIILSSPIIIYKATLFYHTRGVVATIASLLVLLAVSFLKYLSQRHKGIRLAYYYLIALEKVPQVEAKLA